MKKPNTLLKVVSILYIVFSIISGIIIIVGSLGVGALLGDAAGSMGAGLAWAALFAVLSLSSVIVSLVAGLNGAKAQNLNLCKTLGIILIVLAAISFIVNIRNGEELAASLFGFVLPILYMVGVIKEING